MCLIVRKFIFCAFFILCFNFVGLFQSCYAATNLAFGKSYKISAKPNYMLSAPSRDQTSLTDGKYTFGHFWTDKRTVGWQAQKNIEILIDLEKVSDIGSIILNTVRGVGAGVYYPAHIYAFVGTDMKHFLYVGDIVSSDNTPGLYQTKKFTLDNVAAKGRYVLLEVVPKGYYFFCDEIEITESLFKNSYIGNLDIIKAREYAKQLLDIDLAKSLIIRLVDELKSNVRGSADFKDRLKAIEKMATTVSMLNNFKLIETNILRLRGDMLRTEFPGKSLIIEPINAWQNLSPINKTSIAAVENVSLIMPQGGYIHRAFLVTNLAGSPTTISIFIDNIPNDVSDIAIYQIPFVKSASLITNASMEYVADPLMPINSGFTLQSGESRMVMISAFGRAYGKQHCMMKVISHGFVETIPLTIEVTATKLPRNFTIHTVNWGYLNVKSIGNRKTDLVKDLFDHHINVIVVPPGQIPLADHLNTLDFGQLEAYLTIHKRAAKILLYMAYNWEQPAAYMQW